MIDTHAHIGREEAGDMLVRARSAGVDRVIVIATTIAGAREALEIAEEHEGVFASLGIHPHEAGGAEADRLEELRPLLGHRRAVAVGETGLDHYRDYAPHDAQTTLFDRQLALARDTQKPVVVHTRAAEAATVERLKAFDGTVVLHCFSSPSLLQFALDRRCYVSFAGNLTYKNAYDLRVAARAVPRERLLVETDSPYLAPQPVRGKPNEPANVVHTLEALASARREDAADLAAQVDANATVAFDL